MLLHDISKEHDQHKSWAQEMSAHVVVVSSVLIGSKIADAVKPVHSKTSIGCKSYVSHFVCCYRNTAHEKCVAGCRESKMEHVELQF